jgi:hypothetical protein
VDARMSQFHPSLAKLNYERGKVRRELESASRQLRFSNYLKRVLPIGVGRNS